MQKFLFSVYDSKAAVYGNPFTSVNVTVAIRDFQAAAQSPNSSVAMFPEDYTLFQLGSFDDSTGVIEYLQNPVNLGLASQFRTTQEG